MIFRPHSRDEFWISGQASYFVSVFFFFVKKTIIRHLHCKSKKHVILQLIQNWKTKQNYHGYNYFITGHIFAVFKFSIGL